MTKRLRRRLLLAALLLVLALAGLAAFQVSRLSDIRPPELAGNEITQELALRGRELISRLEDAHGGYAAWIARPTVRVEFRNGEGVASRDFPLDGLGRN